MVIGLPCNLIRITIKQDHEGGLALFFLAIIQKKNANKPLTL